MDRTYNHFTMRRIPVIVIATSAAVLLSLYSTTRPNFVAADTANVPSLIISQLKITSSNGQFITLYNPADTTVDMGKYQLQYFNSYDINKATSSRLIALSGSLPPHGYYMINDSQLLLCYQLTVNSVSLGLSSTAGLVGILEYKQTSLGSAAMPFLQDYVAWSKTAATGAQTLPASTSAFLLRQPSDANNHPLITLAGSGSWQTVQPDAHNACNLITNSANPSPAPTGLSLLLPPTEPPATIVNISEAEGVMATMTGIPASDIGLMAPQITELLPNPDGTGNDSTDEYIELHNPNSASFDLTDFILQAGNKTFRSYTFPAGTTLAPNSFTAFHSEVTGLSLSNTGGLARLLDPLSNSISASATYTTAKDGQAWALANGKWYWTTTLTPSGANVIKQPVSAKKAKSSTTKAKSNPKSGTSKAASKKSTKSATQTTSPSFSDEPTTTPIHGWVLALVAGLALLYGAYEYRADLGNRIYQLRQYLVARRQYRQQAKGR